ncbi:MFS toxin efflux pump [Nemania sp. FL0031]|nr:MFS toxin efflux pump [Nemania sp. FL0031]
MYFTLGRSPNSVPNNLESGARNNEEDEPEYLQPWELVPIFAAMALGIFILGLDNTIIGTATPTITNEFHSLTDFGWYGSAYRLATCSSQFLFSKIYEQFRVKWILVAAVGFLEIGSVVSATAPSSAALIVGRAIAGFGSAGILTGVFIVIIHSVPPLAPVIGGALTTYVTWRWCFWINLPVGGFTIVVLVVLFKNPANQKISEGTVISKLKQLNIFALFIFTGSVVALLLALQWGGTTYGWGSARIIALLVVAAVTFGAFVTLEMLRNDRATIPSSVFLNRTAGLCMLYAFCASAAFNVVDYFLPIWFQAIKGASAVESGAMLLPSIVGLAVAAISSGFVVSFIGYYTPLMVLGSTMMAIGFGFLTSFTPNTGRSSWVGWQVLFGLGFGLAFPQPWTAIQTTLPAEDIPAGLSAISFAISIGAALFISISQNIFTNLLRSNLSDFHDIDVDSITSQGVTDLLKALPISEKEGVIAAYNFAVTRTFWACVAVAGLAFFAALCMEWRSVKAVYAYSPGFGSLWRRPWK